ncbi:MAG TPA: hypothetical protein VGB67_00895, partial [Fibrella sp.]
MADEVTELANQLTSPANAENLPYLQMRFGVVTAINPPDNTCTIQLSGDTSLNISGIKAISMFQPAVNDTVVCFKQGTDVVVFGKVQTSTSTNYAQITNIVSFNNVISGIPGGTGFFTLSSTPNSVNFTKRHVSSNLFVSLSITGWGDVTSTGFTSGVNVGGVDYITGAINLDLTADSGGDTQSRTQRVPCVGSTVI